MRPDEGSRSGGLADSKRPSLPICPAERVKDRTPRGSLLACMTANRERSNQSFEGDREATVCFASRRFFLIISGKFSPEVPLITTTGTHYQRAENSSGNNFKKFSVGILRMS